MRVVPAGPHSIATGEDPDQSSLDRCQPEMACEPIEGDDFIAQNILVAEDEDPVLIVGPFAHRLEVFPPELELQSEPLLALDVLEDLAAGQGQGALPVRDAVLVGSRASGAVRPARGLPS